MTKREKAKLIDDCWRQHWEYLGSARAMTWKASRVRWNLRALTFVGIAGPALVGSLYAAKTAADVISTVSGWVLAAQLVVSIWALVARWDEDVTYATSSADQNICFAHRWKHLAEDCAREPGEARLVAKRELERDAEDLVKKDESFVAERDRRYCNRVIHYERQAACPVCSRTPSSMKASNCDTCGNFDNVIAIQARKAWAYIFDKGASDEHQSAKSNGGAQ